MIIILRWLSQGSRYCHSSTFDPLNKPRSRKRTYTYTLRSMRTLRFLLIARAGRLARIGGQQVVQMTCNPTTQILYDRISHVLGT